MYLEVRYAVLWTGIVGPRMVIFVGSCERPDRYLAFTKRGELFVGWANIRFSSTLFFMKIVQLA